MKNKYPIPNVDLRFQVDHINPKKIQLFQEHRDAINIARLFMILLRQRQFKTISDDKKITDNNII